MSVAIPSLRAAIAVPPWVKNELWRRARTVPSLDLRFADNKSLIDAVTGASLVTFTRASSGTFVDSAGVLQTAAADVPRFDHDPTTGESLGLLVEEQRTNLLLQSEEFNTTWTKIRSSVTPDATTSPSGAITADKLVEDTTANNSHIAIQSVSVSSGSFTYSVYAKKGERNGVALRALSAGSVELFAAWFSLDTGAIYYSEGALLGLVASSRNVGNGWYRCIITGSFASANTASFTVAIGDTSVSATAASNPSYTGDGTSGIFLWGAQLEAGAFPTSYIPTTTAAVTRSADVASITGSAFSGWYSQSEGTLYAEGGSMPSPGNPELFLINDGSSSNRIVLRRTGASFNPAFVITTLGTTEASVTVTGGPWQAGATGKIAGSYATNDARIVFNGTLGGFDVAVALPTVSQAVIGSTVANAGTNMPIRRIVFWPQRLANSTLQSITS